jgi:dipeptidyl aminopeptidase/acylaminoacyl peptidase/thiol-disulfide isomerase/thioredoxin
MRNFSVCSPRSLMPAIAILAMITSAFAWVGIGAPAAMAAAAQKDDAVTVNEWLLLGPLPSPLPAFHDEAESKKGAEDVLAYEHISTKGLLPVAGDELALIGGGRAKWVKTPASGAKGVSIPPDTTMPWIAYLAGYIEAPRWMKIDFEATGTKPFEVKIDGSSVMKRASDAKPGDEGASVTGDAKIEMGKHLILVKTAYVPSDTLIEWRFNLKVSPAKGFSAAPVVSTDPIRTMNLGDVLDAAAVQRVDVSADGSHYAAWISRRTPPEGEAEGRLEIRRLRDNALVETLKDMKGAGSWSWSPAGHKLSYVASDKDKSALRIIDIDSGRIETILEDVEDFGGYRWSPDGSYIAYSIDKKYKPDDSGVKRLRGIYDRRNYERDRSFLHLTSVPGGVTRELTDGQQTTYIYDVHPGAGKILVGRYYEDLSVRPYAVTEISTIDVASQKREQLLKGPWIDGALWSPGGDKILVLGGPSAFGDVGVNLPKGVIPNEYDTQAYLFDPRTRSAEPITKDFSPSIQSAFWPSAGNYIYFLAEQTEYWKLYKYNVKRKTFTEIKLPCDVVYRMAVARDKAVAVCVGSSANEPPRLYSVDLTSGRYRVALDPAEDRFKVVKIGDVEDWDFTAASGVKIVGRVHYPPDFDPAKTYPCIVYYYGGTSPVIRSFGGRYPKNLWAANGYVVYVLQPSGATGFGQEFSAVHVNDWGKTTTAEIIEGVGKFLKAHPFVDPKRVGCIGASYGGFMTELLITKTDIFAAAISHAGISGITSYWGEGYWGYEYSADATANSFPWNRQDIYVGHSPIYAADKVNTPLLLLHGTGDTNVPPGESEAMYTALKLLGKEVEYIRILGENHWILDYKKRIAWSDAIVAWFDKCLKDEPQWWDDMYPPLNERGEEIKSGEDEEDVKTPAAVGAGESGGAGTGAAAAGDGGQEVEMLKVRMPLKMAPRVVQLKKYGTVLLGEVTREDIAAHLPDWNEEYFTYEPDPRLKADLDRYLKGVQIKCVIGTWCPDCRREIPRLWRILEEVGYPVSSVKMYAVASSRFTKDMPIPADAINWSDTIKKYYKVDSVATIMFMRNGVELGRIVESPDITLEEDMLSIVKR